MTGPAPQDGEAAASVPGRGSAWRAIAFTSAAGVLLHELAVLWVWHSWQGLGRGGLRGGKRLRP